MLVDLVTESTDDDKACCAPGDTAVIDRALRDIDADDDQRSGPNAGGGERGGAGHAYELARAEADKHGADASEDIRHQRFRRSSRGRASVGAYSAPLSNQS